MMGATKKFITMTPIRSGLSHAFRPLYLAALWCALCAGLAGAADNPTKAAAAAPAHHRGATFQNNYLEFEPKGLPEVVRWKWRAQKDGLPLPPAQPTPTVDADRGFINANAKAGRAMEPAVTWIGHATVLAQLGGLNVLTDPMFSDRASPVSWLGPQRAQPPALGLAQLPRIDVVVVSHNHHDHCDEASLKALNAQPGGPPLFIVPLRLKAWLAGIGVNNVVELDWWQSHKVGDVDVVFTPVQHASGRNIFDQMKTLWGGYALFAPEAHLFFAGDTGYSKDFQDIRQRFAARQAAGGFDVALIPIGGYEPRWYMGEQQLDPEEAVRVHRDLGARKSIGVRWGTFSLSDESLDAPPSALAQARKLLEVPEGDFFLLAIGETRKIPRRLTANPAVPAAVLPTPKP
jgi:N-acyl-phosphatidylethanolamine-hydrolysing phospholipase D